MESNILLAGVGGQGILSQAFVLCNAALEEGLNFKQAEVHGMAQRGGAVQSNLRISSDPISSDLIPKGACNLVLSVEPMEALRYFDYLGPDGVVVTSINPFVNIPNYPEMNDVWRELGKSGRVIPIDSASIAKHCGSQLAANMVMLGAASNHLKLKIENLEKWVRNLWSAKGDKVVDINLQAFHAGRKMSIFLAMVSDAGIKLNGLRALAESISVDHADTDSVKSWVELLKNTPEENWGTVISEKINVAAN